MIRVLISQKAALWRGALAAVLSQEQDVEVVAELDQADEIQPVASRERPDVVVLDPGLLDASETDTLTGTLRDTLPECGVLLVVERPLTDTVRTMLVRMAPRVGLVATDASPDRLLDAVRLVADGKPVMDIELAFAAMQVADNPLTSREQEVLRRAMNGAPVRDIAAEMYLSAGTVRNYLSKVLAKTGARSRIEAIRIAQDAGWI